MMIIIKDLYNYNDRQSCIWYVACYRACTHANALEVHLAITEL